MLEQTTIAEVLSHVFSRLEKSTPVRPGTGKGLFQSWKEVLGSPNHSDLTVIAHIGQVSTALLKLETQIQNSQKLRTAQKNSALQTVNSFKVLFEISNFQVDAHNFRPHCSEISCGNLGLIGHSLASEFSEPKLEKPDADEISGVLNEVKQLLDSSTIPLDLRISLNRHIDAMLWWLAHPEMVSVQDIFETVGSSLIVAKQIEDRDTKKGSSENATSKSIFEKVKGIAVKVGDMVGMATRGVEATTKLTSSVNNLLENFSSVQTPPPGA